jgi:hypothetical protein
MALSEKAEEILAFVRRHEDELLEAVILLLIIKRNELIEYDFFAFGRLLRYIRQEFINQNATWITQVIELVRLLDRGDSKHRSLENYSNDLYLRAEEENTSLLRRIDQITSEELLRYVANPEECDLFSTYAY